MKRPFTETKNFVLIISFFAALLSLRLFQWSFGNEYLDLSGYQILKSLLKDGLLALQVFTAGALIRFLIRLFFKGSHNWIMHLLNVFVLLINYVLISVFLKTKMPLDETIYRFSFEELKIITGGENHFHFSWLLFLALTLVIYFGTSYLFSRRSRKEIRFPLQATLMVSALAFTILFSFTNRFEANSVSSDNLFTYFTQRSVKYVFDQNSDVYIRFPKQAIAGMNKDFFGGKNVAPHYPLLHELPVKSELGKHLNRSKNGPPNIVYIIVESLSSDFVGKYADRTGHLMPFLDSLSGKSLYWPNTLSAYSRTVHVLPASLASAPFTSNGSHFQSLEYPNHLSLLNMLHESHYSRFYCGVDLGFSDMRKYMNYLQTDYLVSNWESPFSHIVDGVKNMWGYPDGQMFEKSWADYRKQRDPAKKRFDVFLTCSTHGPFVIPDVAKYSNRVKAKIAKIKAPTKDQKYIVENAAAYASFSYVDEQLRQYFKRAQQEKDFENTIFVIFGDHGSELAYSDELSYFKIPLLIYSPLVKKPRKFENIASQLDLPPTLLNYLKNEYQLKLPDLVAFLGRELPFQQEIRRDRSLMLGFVGRKNKAFLDKDFYLFDNDLFKIDARLKITKVSNDAQRNKMLKQIENGEKITDYVIYNNFLVPENLYLSYYKSKKSKVVRDFRHAGVQQMKGEFIGLGEKMRYKPAGKFIHVEISYDVMTNENIKPKELPPLAFSIEKTSETILWNTIPYQNHNAIYKDKWTHVKASAVYRVSEINKLKKNDLLHQYILNTELKEYKMKNLKYTVSYS